MDFSKFSQNNWIGIGGGIVALISGWLPWYGQGGFNASGFAASGFWGNVGIMLAVQAAAILVLRTTGAGDITIGKLNAEQIGMILAALGTVFILLRFILGLDGVGVGLQWGAFVGLIGAVVATAGSFLSAKDKGIGIPTADDLKGSGGPSSSGGSTTF